MYIVVGLGNPGAEYEHTRHNVGRLSADLVAEEVSGVKVVTPDTYMNKSGTAVAKVVNLPAGRQGSKKAAEKLIVIHDDLDLPFGSMKISYNRGSGGHKGVESVIRAIKTKEFIRIRIGIAPTTPSGKVKKISGESAVEKFVLGEFKKSESAELKKILERSKEAVSTIVRDGLPSAMTVFNS